MTWFSGILIFALVWALSLFVVLPWGIRRDENPEPGHADGAPENPMMWRRAAATTVLAAIIWVGIYFVMESGWISLRPG